MSFILDALKKSEAERQRQNAPGFASVPDANAGKSRHKWIWLVALLLGINLAALMAVLYMANRGVEPVPATIAVVPQNTDQSSSSFSDIVAEAKRTRSTPAEAATEDEIAEEQVAAAVTPVVAANPDIPTISESLATFDDLQARGELALPDLHLDIHVFSGQPAERFVFINMTKYKENAKLSEGPVIKQITPEGVVLDYQGTDFLLPRE